MLVEDLNSHATSGLVARVGWRRPCCDWARVARRVTDPRDGPAAGRSRLRGKEYTGLLSHRDLPGAERHSHGGDVDHPADALTGTCR